MLDIQINETEILQYIEKANINLMVALQFMEVELKQDGITFLTHYLSEKLGDRAKYIKVVATDNGIDLIPTGGDWPFKAFSQIIEEGRREAADYMASKVQERFNAASI